MRLASQLAMPFLLRLDPERAHTLTIRALKSGLVPHNSVPADERLRVSLAGLDLPNPIGLAAGFDKNAEVPDAMLGLGFGFVEAGTLTPRAQAGNPRPRIFRLSQARGVINRLGFNNEGHAPALQRLQRRAGRPGIVGVNVGANKDSADRIADYARGIACFRLVANYLTINISSPNTPGLRSLQTGAELERLLTAIETARDGARKPVFLKVAPDLEESEIAEIAAAVKAHGIDGMIVSNTTLSRQGVEGHAHAEEAGGLSGRPLFRRSTWALAAFRKALGPDMPLIGAGGVENAATFLAKIEAGADAVQLYTGLVYGGPGLVARMLEDVLAHLDRTGARHITERRDLAVNEILVRGP